MQYFALLVGLLRGCAAFSLSFSTRSDESPVTKVVQLLTELQASIEMDGKKEQEFYDKSACWCEDTTARKAKDISDAKTQIEELQTSILKLESDVATHGAEVKQLEKDIAANEAAQKEATEVRSKAREAYEGEKTESEQAIGALEAAITVLTGAGTEKKGEFLATTMQEAKLLSVAAGVRPLLGDTAASRALSNADLQVVRHFVERPEAFVISGSSRRLGALQVHNNPFGDYAPQSTQISGILKGLYDSFTSSLEKANAAEGEEVKAHKELMATKTAELKTLKATHEKQTMDKAEKSNDLAENKVLREDTAAQLDADEVFFADTKAACKEKAIEWAKRSELRTQELQGVGEAIKILDSPEAQATFGNASTTLLQVRSAPLRKRVSRKEIGKLASGFRALAWRHPKAAASFLELASEVQAGGHFDKVIATIDQMIEVLHKEEQDDIAHRDRCEGDMNKNKNDMEDLEHAIDTASASISRMEGKAESLDEFIKALEEEIANTKADMAEALKLRNKEVADFKKALSDDQDAIALLDQAIVALSKFYKSNKIPMTLVQRQPGEPEYTVDPDKMPETNWKGGDYAGRQDSSSPVISMISAIKEDLTKEIITSKEDDVAAQKAYEKGNAAMTESLKAQTATKVAAEKELAELDAKIADKEGHKTDKKADLAAEEEVKAALFTECSWVDTHFESRRTSRKSELDGLVEAKNFLAGMEPL